VPTATPLLSPFEQVYVLQVDDPVGCFVGSTVVWLCVAEERKLSIKTWGEFSAICKISVTSLGSSDSRPPVDDRHRLMISSMKRANSFAEGFVGFTVGDTVGDTVGTVGDTVGETVGGFVGFTVGDTVGDTVGGFVGFTVGDTVGDTVGAFVGFIVGDPVGDLVGGFLLNSSSRSVLHAIR